jgi:nicotinamidase-related amidase
MQADPDDAVMLLIDHQSGLFQTVKDMEVTVLRANVVTLAKVATLAKIPVITTASVPQGPNGPLIPEIHKYAPHAKYVARRGQINVWDNPDFVKAVEETKRKTLIIAAPSPAYAWLFRASPRSTRVTRYSPWLMHREPIRKWGRKSRLRD